MKHTFFLVAVAAIYSGCATSKGNAGMQTPGAGGTGAFPTGGSGTGTAPGATGTAGVFGGSTIQPTGTGAAGRSTGTAGSGTTGTSGTGVTGNAGTGAAGTGAAGTGTAGTDGTAGSGGADSAAAFKPPCIKKGSQLVLVGDSYINYINNLAPKLDSRAVMDGALKQGDMYRDYAVAGTSLAVPPLLIPPQWDMAKQADPDIKFVVMDGGGNDVLLWNNQCLAAGSDKDTGCQQVVKDASAAALKMNTDMKNSGVAQILYFFYPHAPVGGADITDWSFTLAKAQCEGMSDAHFQCMFVDTRATLVDPSDFDTDNIHPSASGDEKLADLVWKTMKDNCMAQADSSACCTPQ